MSKLGPDVLTSLLATVTGEPFQPVRLYYTVPSESVATKSLSGLRCIDEDKRGRCWVWLYDDEAASLTFERPRKDLPADVHPIVIGRFRFPQKTCMTLDVRSAERAIEAAKFFAPILGSCVVLARLRVINRWFQVREASDGLDRLDKLLDANVVRTNLTGARDAIAQAISAPGTEMGDEGTLAARLEDVPLVEDLPLIAEDVAQNFGDLRLALRLRAERVHEHWQGNTGVTLADIIRQAAERGVRTHRRNVKRRRS